MKIVTRFLIFCIFYSATASAFVSGNSNISLGAGIFGSRGVLGASGDYFVTDNNSFSASAGADLVGGVGSLAYKYFTDSIEKSDSFWDKCFFFIDCETHLYTGAGVQYASDAEITISSGGTDRKYKTAPKMFGILVAGSRQIFSNNVTFDFEVSYRNIFSGGEATQVSGISTPSDLKDLEVGYRTFGLGFAVGYLF